MLITKFEVGRVLWTRGVNEAIARSAHFAKFVTESFNRHATGDWGDLGMEDKEVNEYALDKYERLLSAYEYPDGRKIWIITEADRSATMILFSNEY